MKCWFHYYTNTLLFPKNRGCPESSNNYPGFDAEHIHIFAKTNFNVYL